MGLQRPLGSNIHSKTRRTVALPFPAGPNCVLQKSRLASKTCCCIGEMFLMRQTRSIISGCRFPRNRYICRGYVWRNVASGAAIVYFLSSWAAWQFVFGVFLFLIVLPRGVVGGAGVSLQVTGWVLFQMFSSGEWDIKTMCKLITHESFNADTSMQTKFFQENHLTLWRVMLCHVTCKLAVSNCVLSCRRILVCTSSIIKYCFGLRA